MELADIQKGNEIQLPLGLAGYVLNILKREQIYFGNFYFEIVHRHIQISPPNVTLGD